MSHYVTDQDVNALIVEDELVNFAVLSVYTILQKRPDRCLQNTASQSPRSVLTLRSTSSSMLPAAQVQNCWLFLQLVKFVQEEIPLAPFNEYLFNCVIKLQESPYKISPVSLVLIH